VVAFTSTITDTPSLRVLVEPTAENGFDRPSQAMIDHIQSIRLERIGKVIGQLAGAQLQEITHAVAVYLGVADSTGATRRGRAKPAKRAVSKGPADVPGITRKRSRTVPKRAVRAPSKRSAR
jgi:hypothetical protein